MKTTSNNIELLAMMPQWYREMAQQYYEISELEKELARIGKVTVQEVKRFASTTIWSYNETLSFAVNNGRLPKF